MTKEIRVDSGKSTIICSVEKGKGKCNQFVDPDNFIYNKREVRMSDITPDKSFQIKRIRAKNKSVRADDKKDIVSISSLSKKQIEDLKKVRGALNG